jgi:hypothetical protein
MARWDHSFAPTTVAGQGNRLATSYSSTLSLSVRIASANNRFTTRTDVLVVFCKRKALTKGFCASHPYRKICVYFSLYGILESRCSIYYLASDSSV